MSEDTDAPSWAAVWSGVAKQARALGLNPTDYRTVDAIMEAINELLPEGCTVEEYLTAGEPESEVTKERWVIEHYRQVGLNVGDKAKKWVAFEVRYSIEEARRSIDYWAEQEIDDPRSYRIVKVVDTETRTREVVR